MQDDTHFEALAAAGEIHEDSDLGSIQINNQVVANIVAITARDIPGVLSMAGGTFKDELKGFFGGRRDSVTVGLDEQDRYIINVKIIVTYGVQLARVAEDVQVAVRDQVQNMTSKDVARVNVFIEDVRHPQEAVDDED